MIAFTSRALYTPLQAITNPLLLVENGAIVSVGTREERELPTNVKVHDFVDAIIAPGLIDIHIHGSVGYDVMQPDTAGRSKFEAFLAKRGVTAYYPTTVTAPLDLTLAALERIADAIETGKPGSTRSIGAQPIGIHLEGPFISRTCRGVHPPEHLLDPRIEIFEKMWNAARGHVRIMTVAPELDGAADLITEATRRGVCISLGHSDATLNAARTGVAAGGRHATHTFNAMRPLSHRDPGILGEVLTNPIMTADVIADGIHVDPVIVKLLANAKGPEKLVLITDAMAAAGMPDGQYQLGSLDVKLKQGKCTVDGKLAGSALTLDCALRNLMKFAGLDLQKSLRAATLIPARVAGAQTKGIIEPGADADFVILSPEGQVRATVIKGELAQ